MIGLPEAYELMKELYLPDNQWYCHSCGHHLGQHGLPRYEHTPNFKYCNGTQVGNNRNWCDCSGFQLYYCDRPRLPTAEEIYEMLCQS